jgi:hypothetical protein
MLKTQQYTKNKMAVAGHNLTMDEFHQYLQNVIDSDLNLRQKVIAVERYIKQIRGK